MPGIKKQNVFVKILLILLVAILIVLPGAIAAWLMQGEVLANQMFYAFVLVVLILQQVKDIIKHIKED